MTKKTVIILSASSDIGRSLMIQYLAAGYNVVGTYRTMGLLEELKDNPNAFLFQLDLSKSGDFSKFYSYLQELNIRWDQFIASNGTMEPIGPFFEVDGEKWQEAICINALMPCRLLKEIYPLRSVSATPSACFMAGGGTNNPFRNYSAYCLSKIMLIKMCELLADEVPDLKTFIIGPGYIKTKIHNETLKAGRLAGENLLKTENFLTSPGTPLIDVFNCIQWCNSQPSMIVSGRNFSVVHDPWKGEGEELKQQLKDDENMFKLRRASNNLA